MTKRLVVDTDICHQCDQCGAECGYFYRPQSTNNGVIGLRRRAHFELICRRCEVASCVRACTFDAIERQDDGVLTVHNLRCVSCKLCVLAWVSPEEPRLHILDEHLAARSHRWVKREDQS
jgi:Fe-S-cluster-containing hydrogenase component 2